MEENRMKKKMETYTAPVAETLYMEGNNVLCSSDYNAQTEEFSTFEDYQGVWE